MPKAQGLFFFFYQRKRRAGASWAPIGSGCSNLSGPRAHTVTVSIEETLEASRSGTQPKISKSLTEAHRNVLDCDLDILRGVSLQKTLRKGLKSLALVKERARGLFNRWLAVALQAPQNDRRRAHGAAWCVTLSEMAA